MNTISELSFGEIGGCHCDPKKSFTGHETDCQDTFSLTSQKELVDLRLRDKFVLCTKGENEDYNFSELIESFTKNSCDREDKSERRELLEREQNRLVEEITQAKFAGNKNKVKKLTGELNLINKEIQEIESSLNYLDDLLGDLRSSIKTLSEEVKENLESVKLEFAQIQEEAEKINNDLQIAEVNNQKIKMEHSNAGIASQKSTKEANDSKVLLSNCRANCEEAHVVVEEKRVISQEAKAELKVAKAALEAAKASGLFTGGASLAAATAVYQAAKLKSEVASLALMASQVKEQGLKVGLINAEITDKNKQSLALLDLTKLKKWTDLLKNVNSISDSLKDAFNTSSILLNHIQEKKERLEDRNDQVRLKVEDVVGKEENIRTIKEGRREE